MALYALDDLDDALAVTRSFLSPVDRAVWAKLALIGLFVGGPGANVFSFGGGNTGGSPGDVPPVELGPRAWAIILAVLAVVVLVGLLVTLLGSILEFVFVEALRTERVTLRRYWGRRWRQGVRLFGFRVALGLVTLAGVAVLAAPFLLPLVGVGSLGSGLSIGAFLLLVPLFLVFLLVVGVVQAFTTNLVVPIMIAADCGVLAGWRRLWPTIVREWKQYLAYAVAGFLLSIVGGVVVGIVTGIGALVLLLPFGVLFAVGGGLFVFVSELAGIAVLAVVGVVYVLAVFATFALAQVPVKAYLRYYALLVLGDVEADFDLIPEQRARVRDESGGDGEPA